MENTIVENLWVKVTYEVQLANIKIPNDILKEIEKAEEESRDIEMNYGRYPKAEDWLSQKINESDCMEWKCEIIDMVLQNQEDNSQSEKVIEPKRPLNEKRKN